MRREKIIPLKLKWKDKIISKIYELSIELISETNINCKANYMNRKSKMQKDW